MRAKGIPSSFFDLHPAVIEPYRRLKDAVLLAREGSVRNVMVVSSLPKEGTSTVAASMALVAAQDLGAKVLLVDANLRAPCVHRTFQLERQGGLTELLMGTNTLDGVAKKTETPNLAAITAGAEEGTPLGSLNVGLLPGLAGEMKARWRLVIWDSAPVGVYSDALLLAAQMDGIALVVGWGTTSRDVARGAKRQLQEAGGQLLGVVFTGERGRRPPA